MTRRALTIVLAIVASSLYAPALAADVTVDVFCCSFTPRDVTIDAGDTVTWNLADFSFHSVTSGSGSTDPAVGARFDAPLDPDHVTFSYRFDVSGTYPYFCRPHEFFDMRGTVIVRCRAGDVNTGAGARTDVLSINGSFGDADRVVTAGIGQPVTVALATSASGPAESRYFVWTWIGASSTEVTLMAQGSTLGCVLNPTPLHRNRTPQPFRCLRGTGIPAIVCRDVMELPAPPRAPWMVTRAQGLGRAIAFGFHGVIEDAGAANATGFSLTNAVILRVE